MSLDKETQNALTQAKDALDERAKIHKAITEAEAELLVAKAELPRVRKEFARERVAALIGSKANRSPKGHTTVAAAQERIESLQDEIEGLREALIDQEEVVLAADKQLGERVAALQSDALDKYVSRYLKAYEAFHSVLTDGFGLMAMLGVSLPALRATQVFEHPLTMRMANFGATSASGTYSGPGVSPEMTAEFGALRQTSDAAAREVRKIQERRQLQEIRDQRERDDRGEGRKCTVHENYAGTVGTGGNQ